MASLAARYTAVVFSLLAATTHTDAAVTSAAASGAKALVTPSTYTVPGAFPTSIYSKYYAEPTATASQVQPIIKDPISVSTFLCCMYGELCRHSEQGKTYPLTLTDPDTVPKVMLFITPLFDAD
jgi:sphingomyelin phosphodiesterase